jgi:hypothetical protein
LAVTCTQQHQHGKKDSTVIVIMCTYSLPKTCATVQVTWDIQPVLQRCACFCLLQTHVIVCIFVDLWIWLQQTWASRSPIIACEKRLQGRNHVPSNPKEPDLLIIYTPAATARQEGQEGGLWAMLF